MNEPSLENTPKVVIVGGGFGGLAAAKALSEAYSWEARAARLEGPLQAAAAS